MPYYRVKRKIDHGTLGPWKRGDVVMLTGARAAYVLTLWPDALEPSGPPPAAAAKKDNR